MKPALALSSALLAVIALGCAGAAATRQAPQPTSVVAPAPTPMPLPFPTAPPGPTATVEPTPTIDVPQRPPEVTLVSARGQQAGQLGSHCWVGTCIDYQNVHLPDVPIRVVGREQVHFQVSGLPPAFFDLFVYPFEAGRVQAVQGADIQGWRPVEATAPVVHTTMVGTGELSFHVDLAPGRYALELAGTWPVDSAGVGLHAAYGFLIELPGPTPTPTPRPSPTPTPPAEPAGQ